MPGLLAGMQWQALWARTVLLMGLALRRPAQATQGSQAAGSAQAAAAASSWGTACRAREALSTSAACQCAGVSAGVPVKGPAAGTPGRVLAASAGREHRQPQRNPC